MGDPVRFIQQMVSLDYRVLASPLQQRFDEGMKGGRITGHKCPVCSRVYVPPKGYCPLDTVATIEEHEVEVSDAGIVTSFTVITPRPPGKRLSAACGASHTAGCTKPLKRYSPP